MRFLLQNANHNGDSLIVWLCFPCGSGELDDIDETMKSVSYDKIVEENFKVSFCEVLTEAQPKGFVMAKLAPIF